MLVDRHNRVVDYLRLSVTDRCDLRCSYCMPESSACYSAAGDWLSFDEIVRMAEAFARLGVRRIRVTGGEPLTRARLPELIGRLHAIDGIDDLSLSTNGTRLAAQAAELKRAGVARLNVSLDTLDRREFARITGRDCLDDVLAGLDAAAALDFRLIKINQVWLPDSSLAELDRMIDYCRQRGFILRLIENMPMGTAAQAIGTRSLQSVIQTLQARHGLIDHVLPGGGPARYLCSPDRQFSIGFITPISQHFCDRCNRVRVTAAGQLQLCLGQENQVDLRPLLRDPNTSLGAIEAQIRDAIDRKPLQHDFTSAPHKVVRLMSATGG